MGYSFSNIQIRHSEAINAFEAEKLAGVLTSGRALTMTEKEEEADVVISVFKHENSGWGTITSTAIPMHFPAILT